MTKVDRPEQNPEPNPQGPSRRRRRILIIVGAVVVAALLAVAISVAAVRGAQNAQARAVSTPTPFQLPTPDKNSPPPPSAAPASPAPQSTSSSKPAAPPKVDPRYGAPVAAVVSTGTTATLAGGLTAKLQVADTTAKAVRAGEVAGPAIKVQIELTNPGSTDVSLAQVAVNAYYGKTSIPATELTDGAQPLLGTLKAGETRTGVYLFSVPDGQSGSAVITVTDAAGTPITVFK
ncbi:MAG: hypothetical protein ACTHJI_14825 [Leifsonia sp.]|jgi:hypothetical protein